jgi:prepilin-type N-terminal cleavage/methylation domain-containing protein
MKRFTFKNGKQQRGFTVVELLVATLIFSMVLLVVTMGILQITRVYYKGVTEANTQNTARSIIDTVSQAIQFSGGDVTPTAGSPVPGTSYAFCVGNEQFSYTLGYQVETSPVAAQNQSPHALVQRTVAGAGCASSTGAQNVRNPGVVGRELLGTHMRLSNLQVTSAGPNMWRVTVRVVYGYNDLLNNPTATNASCRGVKAGTQFCSISELSTVVVKRVR